MDEALRHIAPALNRQRYELVGRSRHRLLFGSAYRPAWTFAAAVLLFPFGLLALFHQVEEHVTIDLEPRREGGTLMVVSGKAPRRVRRAFAELIR